MVPSAPPTRIKRLTGPSGLEDSATSPRWASTQAAWAEPSASSASFGLMVKSQKRQLDRASICQGLYRCPAPGHSGPSRALDHSDNIAFRLHARRGTTGCEGTQALLPVLGDHCVRPSRPGPGQAQVMPLIEGSGLANIGTFDRRHIQNHPSAEERQGRRPRDHQP